jgi:hypothetical protein
MYPAGEFGQREAERFGQGREWLDRVDEQTLRAVPRLVAAGLPHGTPGQFTA